MITIDDVLRDKNVNVKRDIYQKSLALTKGQLFTSVDESYLEIGSIANVDFSEGVTFVFRGSTRDPLTNDLLNSPGYNIITFEEDSSYIEVVNDCVNIVNVAGFSYSTVAADYQSGVAPFANGVATIVITFSVFNQSMIYVLSENGYDRLNSLQAGTYAYLTRPNVFAMAKNLTTSLDHKCAYYERWQLYNAVLSEAEIVDLRTNWNVAHSDTVFDIGTNSDSIDENTWTNLTNVEDVEIIPLTSSPIAWYDAIGGTFDLDSGKVTSWTDSSGNGNTVTQSDINYKPIKNANNVHFENNDVLETVAELTIRSVICVIEINSSSGDNGVFGGYESIPNDGNVLRFNGTTLQSYNTDDFTEPATEVVKWNGVDQNSDFNIGNSTKALIYAERLDLYTSDFAIELGNEYNHSRGLDGKIYEIMFYGRDLTTTEITEAETYLNTKWSVY